MTYDFFMGQLRVIAIALIAYAAGKGWLSAGDASTITAVLTPIGLIAGPWIWSLYRNANMKLVPKDSVAIAAENIVNKNALASGGLALVTSSDNNPATVTAKVVGVLLFAFLLSAFLAGDARAQGKPLTGNIVRDFAAATSKPATGALTGSAITDIQTFMNAKFLPDLQYALKLSQASKNTVTSDCYQAWIDIITTQQNAVKGQDGTDIAMPDPHVITDFEKLVELRNALQPESPFMVKCSPVASMIKLDIAKFMGVVISGGAGLATLVPGL